MGEVDVLLREFGLELLEDDVEGHVQLQAVGEEDRQADHHLGDLCGSI